MEFNIFMNIINFQKFCFIYLFCQRSKWIIENTIDNVQIKMSLHITFVLFFIFFHLVLFVNYFINHKFIIQLSSAS